MPTFSYKRLHRQVVRCLQTSTQNTSETTRFSVERTSFIQHFLSLASPLVLTLIDLPEEILDRRRCRFRVVRQCVLARTGILENQKDLAVATPYALDIADSVSITYCIWELAT